MVGEYLIAALVVIAEQQLPNIPGFGDIRSKQPEDDTNPGKGLVAAVAVSRPVSPDTHQSTPHICGRTMSRRKNTCPGPVPLIMVRQFTLYVFPGVMPSRNPKFMPRT